MTTTGILVATEVEKSAGVTGSKKHPGFKLAAVVLDQPASVEQASLGQTNAVPATVTAAGKVGPSDA